MSVDVGFLDNVLKRATFKKKNILNTITKTDIQPNNSTIHVYVLSNFSMG